jgi:transglutaminase-like putative cysteine protease
MWWQPTSWVMKGERMSGKVRVLGILLVVLIIGLLVAGCSKAPESTADNEATRKMGNTAKTVTVDTSKYFSSSQEALKEKKSEINITASVESFTDAKNVRVWVPYPKSYDFQAITDVRVDGNYTKQDIYKDEEGNKILYAEWQSPKAKPSLSFTFKIARKEIKRKDFPSEEAVSIPADIKEKYLAPTGLVVTDGEPRKLALQITEGKTSVFSKAEAIYDYVVENYQRDDNVKGCGKGDVCELLATKQGKCADIHSVFVSLARSAGVPAREVFGTRTKTEPEADITGAYHCHAEFYMPGYGWIPVDPSDVLKKTLKENLSLDDPKIKEARNYFFGAQNETYVSLSSGREVTLNPAQNAGKLNYFMYPYCEVDGKALDYLAQEDFKYTVTYKGL